MNGFISSKVIAEKPSIFAKINLELSVFEFINLGNRNAIDTIINKVNKCEGPNISKGCGDIFKV